MRRSVHAAILFSVLSATFGAACAEDTGATRCGEGYCPKGFKCLERADATPICAVASCGDGVRNSTEECDDGAQNSDTVPDACRHTCALPRCGDRVTDTGESCDDGEETAQCNRDCTVAVCGDAYQNLVAGEQCDTGRDTEECDEDCSLPACGDGHRNRPFGEECDDGNLEDGDGCSSVCLLEECGNSILDLHEECDEGDQNSDLLPDACRTDCRAAYCGDGVVDALRGETCDDGSTLAGDGCDEECQVELGWTCTADVPSRCQAICGDGIVIPAGGEGCDDANNLGGDGCSAQCALEPFWLCGGSPSLCDGDCGDGVVRGGETCDDGSTLAGDGCDETCRVEVGWICNQAGCLEDCGDGLTVGVEGCDDGNSSNSDGCLNICEVAQCGDGYQWIGVEGCDDGNTDGGDGCSATCQKEDCGNGVVDTGAGEECDDGNASNNDACPSGVGGTCQIAFCGDGFLVTVGSPQAPIEGCDDANQHDGDGCSAACQVEPGWTCSGTPAVCHEICSDGLVVGREQCDDRNLTDGDGCTSGCAVEPGWSCDVSEPSLCQTVCGDGLISTGEECDDSNLESGDGCSAACLREPGFLCEGSPTECDPICGDALVRGGEACDDGAALGGDGCGADCQVEPGWQCDGLSPSHCASVCGDGLTVGTEQCDDQNGSNADACPDGPGGTCRNAFCGDGFVRTEGASPEGCDDGNVADHDGCSAACTVEPGWTCVGVPSLCTTDCGDSVRAGSETCDDGNTDSGDGCSSGCQTEPGWACIGVGPTSCDTICGDSLIVAGESCDDGNAGGGDGCSSSCLEEAGYDCTGTGPGSCLSVCGDAIRVSGETCDDGNLVPGDGCSNLCQQETGWTCVGAGPLSCTPICGDALVRGEETCDLGTAGNTGAYGGCNADCTLAAYCGDGILNGPEACDQAELGAMTSCTLVDPRYNAGTVSCTGGCVLDTSDCYRSCNNAGDCVPSLPSCVNKRCVADAGDDCPGAIPLELSSGESGTFAGNTSSFSDDYDGSGCPGIPWSVTDGPDQVWSVSLEAGQALRASLVPAGWDGLLYLTSDCAGLPASCLAGWDRAAQAGVTERLHFVAPVAGTYYLIVDGAAGTDGGGYSLDVSVDPPAVSVDPSTGLIITEIMPDPAGHPFRCQWFEIYNPTGDLLNLEGLVLDDGISSQPIDAPLLVGPGQVLLFATTGEPDLNCGLPAVDWLYEDVELDPVGPALISIQTSGGSVIDEVSYQAVTWPYSDGHSAFLCSPETQDASSNDDPSQWRQSPIGTQYSTGHYGTPRAANPPCL